MMDLVPLAEIFEPHYGANLELYRFELCEPDDSDAIRFVSRKKDNNGVSAFVKQVPEIQPNPADTLSVAGGGTYVLSTFLQSEPYYSGRDVYYLVPRQRMSEIQLLYYSTCIYLNRYKYNYGRQANRTLAQILVPSKMPSEFSDVDLKKLSAVNNQCSSPGSLEFNTQDWEFFPMDELFEVRGTTTTPEEQLQVHGPGPYPYVTTQETNNGVEGFYDFFTEAGNVLTIDSAVAGYCSYQASRFSASDHVEKLIPRFPMNRHNAMFLVTVLNLEQYRFNYGRKSSQDRIRQARIKLPAKDGRPDFIFMERYAQSLRFSASI